MKTDHLREAIEQVQRRLDTDLLDGADTTAARAELARLRAELEQLLAVERAESAAADCAMRVAEVADIRAKTERIIGVALASHEAMLAQFNIEGA